MKIGNTHIKGSGKEVHGEFVERNQDTYYRISNVDQMPTFFMTVVSSTDQWMFLASNGGITAGRNNPEFSLFPYYTDDKIVDGADLTGSKTLLRIIKGEEKYLWEPFSNRYYGVYNFERNLYKNRIGNKVLFEEKNLDLGVCFSYEWTFSPKFGFVKRSQLLNIGGNELTVEVLDGIRNLLPWGINSQLQNIRSTLADAYKKNELMPETGLAIFSLSSMIVDRAEPSEALRATTVWSTGLEGARYLLSTKQLDAFRKNQDLKQEEFRKAEKAAYFLMSTLSLGPGEESNWQIVSEVGQSTSKVINTNEWLKSTIEPSFEVNQDIKKGTKSLRNLVGLADGIQMGSDKLCNGRHFSNVLFNIMRGGIFENQYHIDLDDLKDYFQTINRKVFQNNLTFFESLPEGFQYMDLLTRSEESGDSALKRICLEYLPLSFSRRHGDPSRPWNNFSINIEGKKGKRVLDYEGNWRDIFQNWEALVYSFPAYIGGMITKFVNASTADGYNPYRITREGIDWEVIEPANPWSYIGYWGDHQIIYLQKLLEHAEGHYPGLISKMLVSSDFTYADVPYRIKGFDSILENPFDTITFDHELDLEVNERVKKIGSDGKLLMDSEGGIITASLAEKLLISLVTKLYNFVPDGGIWLNTQRPEWNDANNALVGNGLSLVTLHYLRRYMIFIQGIFKESENQSFELHQEVIDLLNRIGQQFDNTIKRGKIDFEPKSRMDFVKNIGEAGADYRKAVYAGFSGGVNRITLEDLCQLIDNALVVIDNTLLSSKRKDGLYHSYNLIHVDGDEISIGYLYEMLEGQVAALSSGLLGVEEAHQLLDNLKGSAMFRSDQYSYLLYPDRELPHFAEKNQIPDSYLKTSKLFHILAEDQDNNLIETDTLGNMHFAGHVHNSEDVTAQLDVFRKGPHKNLVDKEESLVMTAFEEVFNHKSFTGRSGTFYGYEGLGSIYWHMVSKLLLAVQENILSAVHDGNSSKSIGTLIDHYYEIRAGIGFNKPPDVYGAFPTDAYSHTPADSGAKQPGMTGQVKEDILNRWAELGIEVDQGSILFDPDIFRSEELLSQEKKFSFLDVLSNERKEPIGIGEFAFTYCGTLVRYRKSENQSLSIITLENKVQKMENLSLSKEWSREVFHRTGKVKEVILEFPF